MKEFTDLLCLLQRIKDTFHEKGRFLQEKLNAKRDELFKQWKKKNKSKSKNYQDCPEVKALSDKITEWSPKFAKFWIGKEKEIETRLDILAQTFCPLKSEEKILFDRISSSTWSTQGFGEVSYARNYATRIKNRIEAAGIKAEIVEEKEEWGGVTLFVYAYTDYAGVQILKRKRYSLAAEIQGYWARGLNPRVDFSFLPPNYEESIGINYNGTVIDTEKFNKALQESP